MKVRKKLRGLIAVLMGMAILFGSTMVTQAASYTPAAEYDGLSSDIKANCVAFARYKVPTLPGGLLSLEQKKNIINSYTPTVGAIAITQGNSEYGHVAYVEAVNGNNITTLNGGYGDGSRIYRIIGTASEQKILGYWSPNGTPSTEVSLSFSADRCEPDQSNVFVYTEANTNVSGSFTEAGVTLWDENNQVVAKKSEATSVSGTKLKIYYNITNETGVVLQSGTNYKYQLYTVFNGKRYETTVKTFKTLGQASNAWTSDLTMEDWTYGETAKIPSISAKYGNVVYTYSTEKNGNYSANKPKDAGTYYVKATVAATEEYTGLESVKEFHIRKAVPSYDMPQGIKAVYGQKLSEVQLPDGFVWADATEVVGNVGEKTFAASFVPEDTKNYITVENLKIAVAVEPKDMSRTKLTGIDKNTDLNRYEIKDGDTVLVKEQDYTIDVVKANDKVTVKVTFKGNYTGKAETTYSVKNAVANAKDGQKNTAQATDKTNTKNKAAKTGDYTTTELLAMLVVLAGAVILVTGKKRFAK